MLKKARLGVFIMGGGFALAILLTATLGRYFPVIGILGLFVALGGYTWAYSNAKCGECGHELMHGPEGLAVIMALATKSRPTCSACGNVVRSKVEIS